MSRGEIAIVAVRAVAIWFFATAVAETAGLLLWASSGGRGMVLRTMQIVVVLTVAVGTVAWCVAPRLGARMYPDRASDGVAGTPDLYRAASALTGVLLLGQSVPSIAGSLASWVLGGRGSVLGAISPTSDERLVAIAGFVTVAVRLLVGMALVAIPNKIEQAIRRIRGESDPDEDANSSQV